MIIDENDISYLLLLAYLVVGGEPDLLVEEDDAGEETFKVISGCSCDQCKAQKAYTKAQTNPIAAVRYYVESMMLVKAQNENTTSRLH